MKIWLHAGFLFGSASAARVAGRDRASHPGVKGPVKFTKVGGTTGIGGTTEYCLDVHGVVTRGATVKAKACHGGDDQMWMYNMNGAGRLQIGSGKMLCLTQSRKGQRNKDDLDQMTLQDCKPDSKLQHWTWSDHPNKKTGKMRLIKNTGSGQCMGLRYATMHNGGKAITDWKCSADVNQAVQLCNDRSKPGCWKSSLLETAAEDNLEGVAGLDRASRPGVKGPVKFTKVGGTTGIGGTTEYCLDVHGVVTRGATVKAKTCHGGDDQMWMYNMNGAGRLQIGSGKMLCLTQSKKGQRNKDDLDQMTLQDCKPKSKLQHWTWSDHPNKKNGKMRLIKNTGSGQCMGVRYATMHNGGKAITDWKCSADVNQAVQLCNDMSKPGCSKSSLLETAAGDSRRRR